MVDVQSGHGTGETVPDGQDLARYIAVLVRRWMLFVGVVMVGILMGLVVALTTPKSYEAEAVLAPVKEANAAASLGGMMSGQLGKLGMLVGDSLGGGDRKAYGIALLRARGFVMDLIQEENLLPELFPEQWDPTLGRWRVVGDEVPTLWDGYRMLEKALTVTEAVGSDLVTVSVVASDAAQASRWVRMFVDRLNREMQALAILEAERSIAFLEARVESTTTVEMRQTLFGLIEQATKKAMMASVRDDYAFQVLDPPYPPDMAVWPKKRLIVVVATALAAVLALLLVFLTEYVCRYWGVWVSSVRGVPNQREQRMPNS